MFVLEALTKTQGQEESGWNVNAKGGCTKIVLMMRTWTAMANCAPYAKPNYSIEIIPCIYIIMVYELLKENDA